MLITHTDILYIDVHNDTVGAYTIATIIALFTL